MGWEKSSQIPFAEAQSVLGLPATDPTFSHHMSDVFYEPPSSSWPGPEQGALQQQAKPESSWLLPVVPRATSCHRLLEKSCGISSCGLPAGWSVSSHVVHSLCCVGKSHHQRLTALTSPCSPLTAHTASETVVRGIIGQPVTLPCSYQVTQPRDISDMCWGRGPCPNSKCRNKILHTTGSEVTFRVSQRYNLYRPVYLGDVSLTIGTVQAEDAGTYCCRVEIPGLFNDIKRNIRLEVARGGSGDLGDTASREKALPG